MAQHTAADRSRSPFLDVLRAFAIGLVLLRHGVSVPAFEVPEHWALYLIHRFSANGWLGVDLFFVLSGYLLTTQVLRANAAGCFSRLGFLRRRVVRTLPPYFLVLFVSWTGVFGLSAVTAGGSWDYLALLQHVLLINDYFQRPILVVFWSLAVEEKFYLAMALLLPLLNRCSPQAAFLMLGGVTITLIALRCAVYEPERIATYSEFFWRYRAPSHYAGIGILFGSMTAITMHAMKAQFLGAKWLFTGTVLCAVVMLLGAPWTKPEFWRASLLLIPAFCCASALAIWMAPYVDRRWGQLLSRCRLGSVAVMAYSLYLTHYPIAFWLNELLQPATSDFAPQALFWIAYLSLSGLVGMVFYRLIEKPCIVWSRGL